MWWNWCKPIGDEKKRSKFGPTHRNRIRSMILGTQWNVWVCFDHEHKFTYPNVFVNLYTILVFGGCFLLLLAWFWLWFFVLFCSVSSQLSNNQVWILFICKLNHNISLALFVTKNLFGYFKQSHKPFPIPTHYIFLFTVFNCSFSPNMQSQHKKCIRFYIADRKGM